MNSGEGAATGVTDSVIASQPGRLLGVNKMNGETKVDDIVQIEKITSTQVGYLRTIIGGLVSLLAVAVAFGIFWANLGRYEEKVENQKKLIADLQGDVSETKTSVEKEISDAKTRLSGFGNDFRDLLTADDVETVCPSGSAVVGVVHRSGKMFIRCASLGKALWTATNEEAKENLSPVSSIH